MRRPILPTQTENVAVTDRLGEAFATKCDPAVKPPSTTRACPVTQLDSLLASQARRWRHRLAVRLAQVAYLRPSKIRQSLGLDRKRPKRDCILDPQERAAEQQADRSIESFYGRSGDRAHPHHLLRRYSPGNQV